MSAHQHQKDGSIQVNHPADLANSALGFCGAMVEPENSNATVEYERTTPWKDVWQVSRHATVLDYDASPYSNVLSPYQRAPSEGSDTSEGTLVGDDMLDLNTQKAGFRKYTTIQDESNLMAGGKKNRLFNKSVEETYPLNGEEHIDLTQDVPETTYQMKNLVPIGGRFANEEEIGHAILNPIVLEGDGNESDSTGLNSFTTQKGHAVHDLTREHIIDLDQQEYHLFDFEDIYASATPPPEPARRRSSSTRRGSIVYPARNQPIVAPFIELSKYNHLGNELYATRTVSMKDGDFLRITAIVKNLETGEVTLRGHNFVRNSSMNGLLMSKINEVCWHVSVELDDPRPPLEQAILEIPVGDAADLRDLRLTNQSFPALRFKTSNWTKEQLKDKTKIRDEEVLVARWRYTCTYSNAKDRHNNRFQEMALEHLRHEHLEELGWATLGVSDDDRRYTFRGETVRGGDHRPTHSGKPPIIHLDTDDNHSTGHQVLSRQHHNRSKSRPATQKPPRLCIDLTDNQDSLRRRFSRAGLEPKQHKPAPVKRSQGQKYTYNDMFCGAGGATRGASMAGLHISAGLDMDKNASESWRANFPGATMYQMWVDAFVQMATTTKAYLKCDILHLSPPCQYFSPAHTVAGKNDSMNLASLYSVDVLIKACKPRLVTLEETFGLLIPRFRPHFNAVVGMITQEGYSVRWKVSALAKWGLPGRRQRLIMIGSCPGEKLPTFPPYTHSETGEDGLKPFNTVKDALARIPKNASHHNVAGAIQRDFAPWDSNRILNACITTSGGVGNYHPSGLRDFTLREYAALLGFPPDHQFVGTGIKRQIGNAVPPVIAKVLFEHLRKALEEADGVVDEVVVLDDEESPRKSLNLGSKTQEIIDLD